LLRAYIRVNKVNKSIFLIVHKEIFVDLAGSTKVNKGQQKENVLKTLTLTKDQQNALDGLLAFCRNETDKEWPAALLEGYAGTGKTTLVGTLVDLLLSQGYKIAVTAPTNKAVSVLLEKVPNASLHATIHSLLGLSLQEEGDAQKIVSSGISRINDYDVVVVDECSMIGSELLACIRGRAKIVFVGDPAQLPPVNEDLSPVFRLVGLRWSLSKIVRQAEGNAIIDLSAGIRLRNDSRTPIDIGFVREVTEGKNEACTMSGIDLVRAVTHEWSEGRDCRILAWRNTTVDRYNLDIFRSLYPEATTPFVPGQTAIVHQSFEYNTHEHHRIDTSEEVEIVSLKEGEHLGLPVFIAGLKRLSGENVTVPIPRSLSDFKRETDSCFREWRFWKNQVRLAAGAKDASEADSKSSAFLKRGWALKKGIAELRHPWAMTVHKAQGSTYDTIFIDWNDLRGINEVDFPRILYTAVTRPSKYLAICY